MRFSRSEHPPRVAAPWLLVVVPRQASAGTAPAVAGSVVTGSVLSSLVAFSLPSDRLGSFPGVVIETSGEPTRRSWRRRAAVAAVGAVGSAGVVAGVVIGVEHAGPTVVTGQASPAQLQPATGRGHGGWWRDGGSSGRSGTGSGTEPAGTAGTATATQEIGVVDIDSMLGYQGGEAAGTGMILSSDGEVLTNNHVVQGATRISVTVVSTGATYTATVVGTDPTDDVAVIQLQQASGLRTAQLSTAAAQLGESVTAVGNAGGTGGTPSAVSGQVTGLDRSITASDENGGDAEQLSGLIETDAAVQPGDSGGPLYGSDGKIIGMDTAASTGRVADAYAIPIATATAIAKQIEAGVDSSTVHQGLPAFLGVSVQDADGGALVAGVARGGAAESAGLVAGDVITGVDGRTVDSAAALKSALAAYSPGQRVRLTWTDASGTSHSASVVLGSGPAD